VLLLVALRVAIGWHFFSEGLDHVQDKNWSSKGFLSGAVGPFAATAKSYLPENHGWERTVALPFNDEQYKQAFEWYNVTPSFEKDKTKKELKANGLKDNVIQLDDPKHPFYENPIYGAWAKQIMLDWKTRTEKFGDHYAAAGVTAEDALKAQATAKPAAAAKQPANVKGAKEEPKADPSKAQPKTDDGKTDEVKSEDGKAAATPSDEKSARTDTSSDGFVLTSAQDDESKTEGESATAVDAKSNDAKADKTKSEPEKTPPEKSPAAAANDKPAKTAPAAKAAAPEGKAAAPAAKTQRDLMREDLLVDLNALRANLLSWEKDMFEYRAELARLDKMQLQPSAVVPYEKNRITDKRKELVAKPAPWQAEIQWIETGLKAKLNARLTAEQLKKPAYIDPEPGYVQVDRIVKWVLMIAGGCLVVGLFTRLAAFLCGLFLLQVVMLYPFWEPLVPKATYYEWVEMLACFALATTGIGRVFGLDGLIHLFFGSKRDPNSDRVQIALPNKKMVVN